MIGHPQGACGAAGVAATVLGMRDGFLPPTINLDDAGSGVRPRLRRRTRSRPASLRERALQLHRLRLQEQRPGRRAGTSTREPARPAPPPQPRAARRPRPAARRRCARSLRGPATSSTAAGAARAPSSAISPRAAPRARPRRRSRSSTSAPARATWPRRLAERLRRARPARRASCALDLQWRHLARRPRDGAGAARGRSRRRRPTPSGSPSPTAPSTSRSRRSSSTTSRPSENAGLLRELARVARHGLRDARPAAPPRAARSSSRSPGRALFRSPRLACRTARASVRQAYTPAEALAIARDVVPGGRARRVFPFRLLVDERIRDAHVEPFDAVVIGAGPAGSAAAGAPRAARAPRPPPREGPLPAAQGLRRVSLGAARGASLERARRPRASRAASAERIRRGTIHHARVGARSVSRCPSAALGISRYAARRAARRAGARSSAPSALRRARPRGRRSAPAAAFACASPADAGEQRRCARGPWSAPGDAGTRSTASLAARLSGAAGAFLGWSRDYAPAAALAGRGSPLRRSRAATAGSRASRAARSTSPASSTERAAPAPARRAGRRVVAHARRANPDLDRDLARLDAGPIGFLGTGPVYFTAKPPEEGGILMVGDAAGRDRSVLGRGPGRGALLRNPRRPTRSSAPSPARTALARVAAALRGGLEERGSAAGSPGARPSRRLMLHPAARRALAARLAGPSVVRFAIRRHDGRRAEHARRSAGSAHIAQNVSAPVRREDLVVDLRGLDRRGTRAASAPGLRPQEIRISISATTVFSRTFLNLREDDLPRRLARGQEEEQPARQLRALRVDPERRPSERAPWATPRSGRGRSTRGPPTLLGARAQLRREVLGEADARHVAEGRAAHQALVRRDRAPGSGLRARSATSSRRRSAPCGRRSCRRETRSAPCRGPSRRCRSRRFPSPCRPRSGSPGP